MRSTPSTNRSSLSLQLGQETVYLIMAIAVFASVVMAALMARDQAPRKDPPIIRMREADGFYFPAGSALVSPGFSQRLTREIIPNVARIGAQYEADVVEVIGHTDEVPLRLSRTRGNLDESLMPLFNGKVAEPPQAADNAGLGMARAVAVARILRSAESLKRFQVMPLSAGAFERIDDTMSDGTTAEDQQERRRIVIRVRRRTKAS